VRTKSKSQAVRLSAMAKIGAGPPPPKVRQCRICLAVETFPGGVSSLARGICTDRAACEERQPPLIP